ncbi:hypothetical protein Bca4012_027018 [Brassica carinata]
MMKKNCHLQTLSSPESRCRNRRSRDSPISRLRRCLSGKRSLVKGTRGRKQEKSRLADKSSSPVSVGQEESRERNEGEEQVVSTDALDPEAGIPAAPVEDPSVPKELSA